jgi:hypothetical protein
MGINSRALYQYLQEDLEAFQPSEGTNLSPDESISSVASGRLLDSFFKKLKDDPEPDFEVNALNKFISINDRMSCFKSPLNTSLDEVLYGSLREFVTDFFHRAMDSNRIWWTLDECFHQGQPGPGSSLGAQGSDFYSKLFSSKLTTTSECLFRHYVGATHSSPLFASAEFSREEVWGHAVVSGNRLSFVPKTRLVARTICTEPNLNMFYQKGLGDLMEAEMRRRYGIDLNTQQTKNRQLALLGSLDGSFCTIDLSSASDTISYDLVKDLIRCKAFLGLVDLLRSPTSALPDGTELKLHMVSTMGNGFTFPLQTLLFAGAVSVVMNSYGVTPRSSGPSMNYGVNGDDIILPNFMYGRMTRFLELLGFEVNRDKSFHEGAFRESCGYDFYRGHNVRGVYVKTLRRQQALYSVINRLNRWSAVHKIWLPKTVGYLMRWVRFLPVPPFEQDDAGVQVPLLLARSYVSYNRNWSYVYTRYVPRKRNLRVTDDKVIVPRRGKKRAFNYEGLLLSFLHGSLRNYNIGIRQDDVRYKYEAGRSPTWDWIPYERFPNLGVGQRPPWEMAVCCNMIDTIL